MSIIRFFCRRTEPIRWRHSLAAALSGLAIAGGALITIPAHAQAAPIPDRIDVGRTILQHGYWKGSGSFSNFQGTYTEVCVGIYQVYDNNNSKQLREKCNPTPKGSGYAFSAPPVRCYFQFFGGQIVTAVSAWNGERFVDGKTSNALDVKC